MNPSSVDVKNIIVSETSALTFKVDLFVGFEPTEPDNCVTIYDSVARSPQLTFDRSETYEYPGIQIRVRNGSYVDGMTLAQTLMGMLHGRGHEEWGGAMYHLIQCVNGPEYIGRDEQNRVLFVLNFDLQRREV